MEQNNNIESDAITATNNEESEMGGGAANGGARGRHNYDEDEEEEEGEGKAEKVSAGLDFKRSQVPGEAFVAAARHNPVSKDGAVFIFKEAGLMLPKPMRRFIWEDFLFNRQSASAEDDGGGGGGGGGRSRRRRQEERVKPKTVMIHGMPLTLPLLPGLSLGAFSIRMQPREVEDIRRQFRHDVNRKIDLKKMHRAVQVSDGREGGGRGSFKFLPIKKNCCLTPSRVATTRRSTASSSTATTPPRCSSRWQRTRLCSR